MSGISNFSFSTDDFRASNNDENFKIRFKQALKHGYFYLKIPSECEDNLDIAKAFANSLRDKEAELRGKNIEPPFGFFKREATQAVSFLCKDEKWGKAYPKAIQNLADRMHWSARKVLRTILRVFEIPKEKWDQATGQLTSRNGMLVFSFNHYKPGKESVGLMPHVDIGWLAMLHIDQEGLYVIRNNVSEAVNVKKGHFIINLGSTFEIFANNPEYAPPMHYVSPVIKARSSFALFLNNFEESPLYKIANSKGDLEYAISYADYVKKCLEKIYTWPENQILPIKN